MPPSPPVLSNPATATAQVGEVFSVLDEHIGLPLCRCSRRPACCPRDSTLTDSGTGSASIAGTPAAGSEGVYPLTLTATNDQGTSNTTLNITVTSAPSCGTLDDCHR